MSTSASPSHSARREGGAWSLTRIVAAADAIRTEYDAVKLLGELARAHGFSHFMIARVARPVDRCLADLIRLTNWPAELVSAYDAAELLASSRVADEIGGTALPVWWDLRQTPAHDAGVAAERALAIFAAHDMPAHLAFAVADGAGTRASISFSGERERPDDAVCTRLHAAALYVNERLRTARPAEAAPSLAPRQRDVLEWIARGKTTPEIAVILGISPHTVDHYAQSAAERLGTVNRTQAVAEAVRQRLI